MSTSKSRTKRDNDLLRGPAFSLQRFSSLRHMGPGSQITMCHEFDNSLCRFLYQLVVILKSTLFVPIYFAMTSTNQFVVRTGKCTKTFASSYWKTVKMMPPAITWFTLTTSGLTANTLTLNTLISLKLQTMAVNFAQVWVNKNWFWDQIETKYLL